MSYFTTSANTNTTIGYAKKGSDNWNVGTSNGAMQGAYKGTKDTDSRVGVMVFSGAGAALKGKNIKRITMKIVAGASGSGASDKVLTFHKARYQYLNTSVYGGSQVGDLLGTITGEFFNNTQTVWLDETYNTALFNALCAYFKEGNSAITLFNGETSSSSGYSDNYARITSCTITVEYSSGVMYVYKNGAWVKCSVWVRKNGTWVRVKPYFYKNGEWKK
jgi:hypothetical protein